MTSEHDALDCLTDPAIAPPFVRRLAGPSRYDALAIAIELLAGERCADFTAAFQAAVRARVDSASTAEERSRMEGLMHVAQDTVELPRLQKHLVDLKRQADALEAIRALWQQAAPSGR